jgi:hypothetical protein
MAVTRFDTTQVINAGAGAVDVTLPGSPVAGDLIVVFLVSAEAFPTAGINTASYSSIHNTTSASPGYQSRYKVMGGTPDTVVNVNARTTDKMVVLVRNYRGIDTSTIPDNGATTSATNTSGMPDAPSYTTVTNGALVIAFGGLDDDDVSSSVTAPSGYGNLLKADTGQGLTTAGSTAMIADKIVTTAGADDPAAFGGTGTDAWRAATWAIRPSTVTAYTLAADSASYAYTATAAGVLYGRDLVAAAASYAYTATAAGLSRGIPLVAGSASYAYTATDAGALYGRSLDAGSASYAFTATAALPLKGWLVGAAGAAYAYTASDATLTYATVGAYSLSADSASYGYTATAAGLLWGHRVDAESAAYAYTATAALPLHGYLLDAGSAAYAYTASDATLTYAQVGAYTLTAESASFAFTPTAATLTCVPEVVVTPTPPPGSGGGGGFVSSGGGVQGKSKKKKREEEDLLRRLLDRFEAKAPPEVPAPVIEAVAEAVEAKIEAPAADITIPAPVVRAVEKAANDDEEVLILLMEMLEEMED